VTRGIYCLIFRNPACRIRIGRLGDREFMAGWHIYVGSAQGGGGLEKRVARHIRVNRHGNTPPKWHIDYFSLGREVILTHAVCGETSAPLECELARVIGGDSVRGFGCSDCSCRSHLFYRHDLPLSEVESAFLTIGLDAASKTLI